MKYLYNSQPKCPIDFIGIIFENQQKLNSPSTEQSNILLPTTCVFFMPNEDMFSMHLRQGLMKYDYIFRKGRLCTTNTCHIIWLQARHMQRLSGKHAIVAGCVKKFGTMLIVLCTNISLHQ